MDDAWKQLPHAAVIVCASVLGAPERSAQASQPDDVAAPTNVELAAPRNKAPTCGSACHGGVETPMPPPEINTAPTCGSACHGGGDQPPNDLQTAPPPVEPAKKGCAVEDPNDHSPLGLALLGVGLLAGVAGRRRRGEDEPRS